ncbi:hypothetical protein PseudUWO310_01585 [Pseudanabaena sp. UWO310]|nr:hypothetical protein PseudUWO310_01585 [Pseudanabaena sp. UWO310]
MGFTAIFDQKNHKKLFESVASQHFQKVSWFGFERKALYVLIKLTAVIYKSYIAVATRVLPISKMATPFWK